MKSLYLLCFLIMGTFINPQTASSQAVHYIRIAKLEIDSLKLDAYKTALALHAQTAIRVEPGVLMLYAVYDTKRPTHVTVFEIYANVNAYKHHIQTPHFLKYKAAVQDMVKALELTDVSPIALEAKAGPLTRE